MTQLRRCSPEIERELHDKEDRIRELEGALANARHALILWTDDPHGDLRSQAIDWADRALTPPDSESQGEVVVTTNERGDAVAVTRQDEEGEILSVIWERDSEPGEGEGGDPEPYWPVDEPAMQGEDDERTAEGAGDYAYSRGEDARLDKHLIERGAIPEWGSSAYTPSQRRDAGDALRAKLADPETMQRVTERAAEQQDAMLERRDACSYLAGNRDNPPDSLLPFESKGTGCVVPEAVRRLPDQWRETWALTADNGWNRARHVCADELDRAIAEQGEQGDA